MHSFLMRHHVFFQRKGIHQREASEAAGAGDRSGKTVLSAVHESEGLPLARSCMVGVEWLSFPYQSRHFL